MADNIDITPGTGKTVATDEVTIDGAPAHVQRVKVTFGTAGAAADVASANPLPVTVTSANSTMTDGRKVVATATSREPLVASSTPCKEVVITAETDNTGIIVVGAAATVVAALATRRGIPLSAGDSVILQIDNLADIGLDSTVSTDGVTFAAFS